MKAANHTWSSGSVAVAHISNVVRLINCDPKFHFVSQTFKDEISVFLESVNDGHVLPSSNVLQRLRKVPVIESNLSAKEKR